MNRVAKEYHVFRACSRQMRVLLLTNIVFTLVLPVVDIFVAAYVMHNSHDVGLVVRFQLAVYTGIPVAFLLNGFLLGRVSIHRLYSLGMLLIGSSMLATMAPEFHGALLGASRSEPPNSVYRVRPPGIRPLLVHLGHDYVRSLGGG